MTCRELNKLKLKEARYDTFIRNIVDDAIRKKDKLKIFVILRPGN